MDPVSMMTFLIMAVIYTATAVLGAIYSLPVLIGLGSFGALFCWAGYGIAKEAITS